MRSIARIGAVALTLGAAAAVPASTLGKARTRPALRSHVVHLSGWIDTVLTTGTIGVKGTRDTDAGILQGTVSGAPRWNGAIAQVVTWGSGLKIMARGTAFDAHGTLRYSISGRFTPSAKGGLALSGALTVTGGTGIYARVKGTLRVSGAAPVGSDTEASTFDLSGKLRF
jgi:hypothetical protein